MHTQVQPPTQNAASTPQAKRAAPGPFDLPPLPYAENALAPVISGTHAEVSLRQTPQDLCGDAE